jgi:putative transposase
MCKVLKVSRSSYYQYLKKKPSNRAIENKSIEKVIIDIHKASKGRYGAHKINESLKEIDINISIKRTQRLMKKLGIKSIIIKKYRPSSSKRKIEEQENILKRDFSTTTINQKWVTDITYIHTIKDGWCYLASVMDLYSRKIVGYSMSKSIDTSLALLAVKNAIKLQKPTKALVLHSDLGCQYTSSAFKEYIDSTKIITHSFSGKGCPYDNACIESFHASLKKEEVYTVKYFDYDAARLAIFEYIEAWYNRKRIHSSIGYISPQKCEDLARKIA